MHQRYDETYPGQFEPADLSEAYEYVYACMKYGLELDFSMFGPDLQADLLLIKILELSRFQPK